jgi:hypothetical protein
LPGQPIQIQDEPIPIFSARLHVQLWANGRVFVWCGGDLQERPLQLGGGEEEEEEEELGKD